MYVHNAVRTQLVRVDTHMFGPPGKFDCAPGLWNEGNKHRTKMNENFKLPEMILDRFMVS